MKVIIESVEAHGLHEANTMMSVRGRDESLNHAFELTMPFNEEQVEFLYHRLGEFVNVEVSFGEVKT